MDTNQRLIVTNPLALLIEAGSKHKGECHAGLGKPSDLCNEPDYRTYYSHH